ncbi:hypothetical protein [Cellulosimicrobium sp. Marseille-Q4280]|uniref:hypothetical protein n=1 Tax=Cellulosimicrobium sp. Marseille-Q4280 TaxID=2937992 RepID=UPI0020401FEA|nr:hypothetical protein [Cellulosimicrobium sp. Marseille-Q4280]
MKLWGNQDTLGPIGGAIRWLPRWMRITALLMISAGVAGAILTIAIDGTQWWLSRPFATNYLSSLVAALIGIPISVVLIAVVVDLAAQSRAVGYGRETVGLSLLRLRRASIKMIGEDLRGQDLGIRLPRRRAAIQRVEAALDQRYYSNGDDTHTESQEVVEAAGKIAQHAPNHDSWKRSLREARSAWSDILAAKQHAEATNTPFISDDLTHTTNVAISQLDSDDYIPPGLTWSPAVDRARSGNHLLQLVEQIERAAQIVWRDSE